MRTDEAFIDHVRRRRSALLRPETPNVVADEALALLGLDDIALSRWSTSESVQVSLPHASPNVFDPRMRVCWYAAVRQRRQTRPDHHLRVVLTHVNFSDLGWRPYAWWYLGEDATVHCHRQFSRNKKRKHVTVASRPPLETVPEAATRTDLAACRIARWGADLAVSYMLVTAVIERAAGMVTTPMATYLPLPLLVSFVQAHAADSSTGTGPPSPSLASWCTRLTELADGRQTGLDGVLVDCPARQAAVLDNYSNLAALSLVGGTRVRVLGGAKMAGYWPNVQRLLDALRQVAPDDVSDPRVLVVPDADPKRLVRPSPRTAVQLEKQGIPYSQGLAVAEHGDFAQRLDPFGAAAAAG